MIRFSPNPNRAHLIRWFEWGEEAFREAEKQNKPVMLFLSAFWCRICQRMDEGAFSDDDNTALLNAFFITIRAENAKRPDVDARYNLNGWPTIVFMTPEGELLAATNYLPSDEFGNLLVRVHGRYQERGKNNGSTAGAAKLDAPTPHAIHAQPSAATLLKIAKLTMELADRVHGGYGRGQKFIHPQANDFLLARYETTKDASYLEHVCLTLDRMREGEIHDREGGGYFRTCSNEDWSRPHREKLLAEQAGLLANCLRAYRITQQPAYARMAEGIIDYLDRKLYDSSSGAFYGCEDFLRGETAESSTQAEYRSFLDRCIYTDANAQTIVAYLDAASTLGKALCQDRALKALEFLWEHCRSAQTGMYHYFDGGLHVPGLLDDQAHVGSALVRAHKADGEENYLRRARELAEMILARLKNPNGGYYDVSVQGPAHLSVPLTLIDQNGAVASFFLALSETAGEPRYHDAALWALTAFTGDFQSYGIHAAGFGQALDELVKRR